MSAADALCVAMSREIQRRPGAIHRNPGRVRHHPVPFLRSLSPGRKPSLIITAFTAASIGDWYAIPA